MRAIFLTLLMISASLAGCFGEEEAEEVLEIRTVWDFERPELTWYHFAGAVDAWGNDEFDFKERNTPFIATGTYYGCLLYTSPSPRDTEVSRMPSSA